MGVCCWEGLGVMEDLEAPGQSCASRSPETRELKTSSIRTSKTPKGRQGRPRNHNLLGRGPWFAARGRGADGAAAGRSEVGERNVGNQRPALPHLGWSIARLVMPPGWKREGSVWAARHSRRGLPAPPSSWPQPPSSASGQRPTPAQGPMHRGRTFTAPAQAWGAAGQDPGAEAQPRGLTAGPGDRDRAGVAGWGRGRLDPGGRGGADWPAAAT